MKKGKLPSFLKWPGGKRWFTQRYIQEINCTFDRYIEPFLGSGAVFFSLLPSNAIISDVNAELINVYQVMRDNPEELKEQMKRHQQSHCETYYYQVRGNIVNDSIASVARTLYLNRTCFNGLYRVNKRGEFNVPIGSKENCTYDVDDFVRYSQILKNAKIMVSDFQQVIDEASKGDLIFADPPYVSNNGKEGFVKYNGNLFTWNDQERLLNSLVHARDRGAKIVLTNADVTEIECRYLENGFFVKKIERSSTVAGTKEKRGKVKELLISSFNG